MALESINDATGKGMFDLLCNICIKYDLDWINNLCAQTYDGAASIQGQYSGLRSYVQEKNPCALYVWCLSHILNLVVVDTCDRCISIRNFFGDMQVLISFIRARKRVAIFLGEQKKCYPHDRVLRIKNFSSTCWSLHDKAISVIHKKYDAVMNTLEILSTCMDRDCSSTAKAY
ncbi:zinc finger MYM-type protein 1-like [Sipha flava]|uniref:Zinc finger MYM-type protein 1 n=1 Tax=Sipha flava TaxID=143950 RepID=A0A2S2Q6H1_9HEMI|nr:zinc finger MYM-type protein 1-like [Sipha flava]